MDLMRAIKVTRGLFWFAVGTAFFISGVVYTVRGALDGFKDEWYAGVIAMVLGALLAGYFQILRALSRKPEEAEG